MNASNRPSLIDLTGQTALVTAGSRGLGAEIARQLAWYGADIAFTYLKEKTAAVQLTEEINGLGRRCLAEQADAKDFARAHEVVERVVAEFGALDILVCNAGAARGAALHHMSETDWDAVIDVSLKGAFNYLHAVGPLFIKQQKGKIVCIGSINGLRGRMGTAGYNAAKAGLVGLVKTAASEWGRYGINVNLVAPGFIETPSQTSTPELMRDLVLKECAIKRLGTPADIAPPVVFLCSDAARHVTGQVLKVDAGQYL
jgi:3-oxoacyl-[acyl-carrier protein] reductase